MSSYSDKFTHHVSRSRTSVGTQDRRLKLQVVIRRTRVQPVRTVDAVQPFITRQSVCVGVCSRRLAKACSQLNTHTPLSSFSLL